MFILLSHELSHYFAARLHHTSATLPYFIPAPSLIGTFGAFIKMTSPLRTRRSLIDIGASGPVAGFVVSLLASIVGLSLSKVIETSSASGGLMLGDSLLFSALSGVVLGVPPEGKDILLHPVAFAGWIGFFVTSLNLIPIGQLDGGHIAYALLGERHKRLSIALVAVLVLLAVFYWEGWALWEALMLLLGIKHPPVYEWEPLDPARKLVGAVSLFIFIITFIPLPFSVAP